MQTARIPIIPNDVCKVFYDSDENETPINVYESTICAGGNGKSACFGDSGGQFFLQPQAMSGLNFFLILITF